MLQGSAKAFVAWMKTTFPLYKFFYLQPRRWNAINNFLTDSRSMTHGRCNYLHRYNYLHRCSTVF